MFDRYWNQIDMSGGRFAFVDGGAVDNTAITMLLRRGVSSIIACYAAKKPIANMTLEQWGAELPAIAALFGAVPSTKAKVLKTPVERFNKMLQVSAGQACLARFSRPVAGRLTGSRNVYR
jgi:hypothetical protein